VSASILPPTAAASVEAASRRTHMKLMHELSAPATAKANFWYTSRWCPA
jgi:hypothetical protein